MKLYEISNEPGRKIFLDKLISFNEERGNAISSCPSINKGLIDLYRLYTSVKERGGFFQTTKSKLWKEVATILNIKQQATSAYILRKQYIKHLLPFECKFDLNGADPAQIVASTENANRKKRKNKNGNEPIQMPSGLQTPNSALNSPNGQPMNGVLPGIGSNNAKDLPSINSMPSANQPALHQQSLNQLPSRQAHLAMQQQQQQQQSGGYSTGGSLPPSNGTMPTSTMNSITINNSIMPNGPSAPPFQQAGSGYNYQPNSNYNVTSYVPNGSTNLYTTNSMYNPSVDYQGKLNHQLTAAQQAQFFSANNGTQMLAHTNQTGLVNSSSIQQNAQQLHANLPNSLTSNQQQTISNLNNNALNQQFYASQQAPNGTMYTNAVLNGTANSSLINNNSNAPQQQPSNDFYSNASYSGGNLAHGNTLYNGSNQQQINNLNSMSQYSDDLIKYGSSSRQTELNSSQSSLNNSSNQYYNGHPDTSSSSNNYSTSNAIYNRQANGYQQINGYSNGMLDGSASAFDKNSSNLIDFHSSIKSDPSSNSLDTYLSDPYSSYEPETKRFHAMSNC